VAAVEHHVGNGGIGANRTDLVVIEQRTVDVEACNADVRGGIGDGLPTSTAANYPGL
jgi:hypothetical protein